jgi:hypothetical protein
LFEYLEGHAQNCDITVDKLHMSRTALGRQIRPYAIISLQMKTKENKDGMAFFNKILNKVYGENAIVAS